MLTVNRSPSPAQLRSFGVLLALFVTVVGGAAAWRTGSWTWPAVIWTAGGGFALVYALVPALRRPTFVGWMYAAFPIGWTVSHLLMAFVYFGVITPIGYILRAVGRDPLDRRIDRTAKSYWVRYTPQGDVPRYFKQF